MSILIKTQKKLKNDWLNMTILTKTQKKTIFNSNLTHVSSFNSGLTQNYTPVLSLSPKLELDLTQNFKFKTRNDLVQMCILSTDVYLGVLWSRRLNWFEQLLFCIFLRFQKIVYSCIFNLMLQLKRKGREMVSSF